MAVIQIGLIVLLVILIVACVFVAINYYRQLQACETTQSPYCYAIVCPGSLNTTDPCKGYAQRTASDGSIICAL